MPNFTQIITKAFPDVQQIISITFTQRGAVAIFVREYTDYKGSAVKEHRCAFVDSRGVQSSIIV